MRVKSVLGIEGIEKRDLNLSLFWNLNVNKNLLVVFCSWEEGLVEI